MKHNTPHPANVAFARLALGDYEHPVWDGPQSGDKPATLPNEDNHDKTMAALGPNRNL
jgi:hypothetical protein